MSRSNSKHGSFFIKLYLPNTPNTYPKGRALIQMYRVVPQTKRGNCWLQRTCWYKKTKSCKAKHVQ